jgi:hypothetical protein
VSATGGEINPVKEKIRPIAKRIFGSVGIGAEKSIKGGPREPAFTAHTVRVER